MRISVLSDDQGAILATLRPAELTGDGPTGIRIHARPGQTVHQILLPEELEHLRSLACLHQTHRVDVSNGEARLVSRRG